MMRFLLQQKGSPTQTKHFNRLFQSLTLTPFPPAQIIRERLPDYPHRNGLIWNQSPGALLTVPTFADTAHRFPFLLEGVGLRPGPNYTAVIFVQIGAQQLTAGSALYKLVKSITKSQFVDKVTRVGDSLNLYSINEYSFPRRY